MNEQDVLRLAGDTVATLYEPHGYVEETLDGQGRVTHSAFLDGDNFPVAVVQYKGDSLEGAIPLTAEIYCNPNALRDFTILLEDALREPSEEELMDARPEVFPKPYAVA